MPNPAHKHHYIPIFYTKRWAGPDGLVQRYTKHQAVVERRVHPSRVGWQERLYELPLVADEHAQVLEERFFRQLDNVAAVALQKMSCEPMLHLEAHETTAWSIFMLSLLHRTPSYLADTKAAGQRLWSGQLMKEVRERYLELRTVHDPATFEQYMDQRDPMQTDQHTLSNLPHLLSNPRICQVLNNMPWGQFTVPVGERTLLLSDNPLARSNGLLNDGGHLAMPLSPRRLLIVAPRRETMQSFDRVPIRQLVRAMNQWTVSSARHFVVATDRLQDSFIKKHFGSEPKPSLHQNIDW